MKIKISYIGAKWCKVCVTVKPAMEALSQKFATDIEILDIDDIDDPSIKKVPTVRIYKDETLCETITTNHEQTTKSWLSENYGLMEIDDF